MRPRTTRRLAATAAVAAVALGVVGGIWLARGTGDGGLDVHDGRTPPITTSAGSESTSRTPAASASPVERADAGVGAQPSAVQDPPVSVTVDDVGLDLAVVPVGVRADGQMDIPTLVTEVGWYRYGPAPGSPEGSAVLSAHVDSELGRAPMSALFDVEIGAIVEITTAGGAGLRFRVEQIEQLGKQQLPLDALFARDGPPLLRLVTCAGDWDPAVGAYEDNLIVTATPVAP